MHSEGDRLRKETTSHSDTLNQYKRALEEAQRQTMEKASFGAQVDTLKGKKRSEEQQELGTRRTDYSELERRIQELEIEKRSFSQRVLGLQAEVSRLMSLQFSKDRRLAELKGRLHEYESAESANKEVYNTKQLTSSKASKRELISQIQLLESQLKQIKEKSKGLRKDVERLQGKNISLSKEMEHLKESLKTTTLEKQRSTHTLEREIERLRKEVAFHIQESSSLNLHTSSQSSIGSTSALDVTERTSGPYI